MQKTNYILASWDSHPCIEYSRGPQFPPPRAVAQCRAVARWELGCVCGRWVHEAAFVQAAGKRVCKWNCICTSGRCTCKTIPSHHHHPPPTPPVCRARKFGDRWNTGQVKLEAERAVQCFTGCFTLVMLPVSYSSEAWSKTPTLLHFAWSQPPPSADAFFFFLNQLQFASSGDFASFKKPLSACAEAKNSIGICDSCNTCPRALFD